MNQAYVWVFPNAGCELHLGYEDLEMMLKLARQAIPHETGGTLVGHYSPDGQVAVIERVLGVRRGARSSPVSFVRPSDATDGQLAEVYASTSGQVRYLGEWHSHPNAAPVRSPRDDRSLVQLARSPEVATDTPLLVIVGGELAAASEVACWVFHPDGQAEAGCIDATTGARYSGAAEPEAS